MNITWIGAGKLGQPCAEAMAQKGHKVSCYDTSRINSSYITQFPTIAGAVKSADIVFVAVPTPHDPDYDGRNPTAHLAPKDFDYSIVKEVLAEANLHMNKDQLLVLISTVLPGTTRKHFVDLVPNTRFVYNPYLIAMGSVAWDMVNPEMVMIGTEDGSKTGDANELVDFYKTIMENNPRYEIGTWDECEAIKVFYNTFISTKIGLVNMIQDVAEKQGNINVDVVTNALAHSTKRIMGPQYMTAGMGDGGGCHPRDNIALRYMAKELDLGYDLFDAIMNARQIQAKNIAIKLSKLATENNYPVYIHGKSYKPGVGYLEGSYSLLIGNYLEGMGHVPIYIDPNTSNNFEPTESGVFLLAHSASTTYNYASAKTQDELYCEIPENSIVVDPWRKFKTNDNTVKVIQYGNTRVG